MLRPHKCLICYCQTEVIEERASPPLDEVQTCHDGANTVTSAQREDKEGIEIAYCLSSPPADHKLSKDLRAIFTLRKLLQVPQDELTSHLCKWGSPGSWISLCSRCNKAVSNAQRIYQQILDATRVLQGMKGDIVEMIKESLDSEPSPSDEEIAGIMEVTVKTREFVSGCEYAEQPICDPFISGDLKANELLKLQEQDRFSNSSRNDEDDDVNGEESEGGIVSAENGDGGQPVLDEDQPPVLKKPRTDDKPADAIEVVLETNKPEHDKLLGEDEDEKMEVEEENNHLSDIEEKSTMKEVDAENKAELKMGEVDEMEAVVVVEEEEDAEQSIQPGSILDSSDEASYDDNVQTLIMTPPPSIPPKLSDCEVLDKKTKEISVALLAVEPVVGDNQKMEEPSIAILPPPLPDMKSTNTIQLSFTIPKLPVFKKEQVPTPTATAPPKVETSWMADVQPNVFAKKSEGPNKPTAKSPELPVPEKLEGLIMPKAKIPETVQQVFQSETQTRDVEIISEVQTSNIARQTIKSENLETASKPDVLATSNSEVAIRQKGNISTLIAVAIKQAARNQNLLLGKANKPVDTQSPENWKEAIKPKSQVPSNFLSQLPTTSRSGKAIPSPSPTNPTTNSPSTSTMEDILGDLDPFVKELLSVPAAKRPPKTKASTSSPPPLASVKQTVQQQQTGQLQNNSGTHGFDKAIIQGNGTWRNYCKCGISYVNSANLSRHITTMSNTTLVYPRDFRPNIVTPTKFQCFICKHASPSVSTLYSDINVLKAHLDQVHHTKTIAASEDKTKTNGGPSPIQILNNDGSFKDTSMDLKRQLERQFSFIPAHATTPLPPPHNTVVKPSPAPKPQQPVESKNVTPYSPITITTTAIRPSRSAMTKTSTPKNVIVRPRPSPVLKSQPPVQSKNLRSFSPVTITTNAFKPLRSPLPKPPSPTKRPIKPRWYVCRHCLGADPPQMKRFNCLAHLTNHIHSEHGGWLCPTPQCGRIFSTWMHLIAHRRKQQCCNDKNVQISKPYQPPSIPAQVQVLETPPITMPKLAERPKPNTLERYLRTIGTEVTKVERKPVTKPRTLVAENNDEVICIDD